MSTQNKLQSIKKLTYVFLIGISTISIVRADQEEDFNPDHRSYHSLPTTRRHSHGPQQDSSPGCCPAISRAIARGVNKVKTKAVQVREDLNQIGDQLDNEVAQLGNGLDQIGRSMQRGMRRIGGKIKRKTKRCIRIVRRTLHSYDR